MSSPYGDLPELRIVPTQSPQKHVGKAGLPVVTHLLGLWLPTAEIALVSLAAPFRVLNLEFLPTMRYPSGEARD